MRLGVYGTGKRAAECADRLESGNEIIFYVQTNPDRKLYHGYPVIKADDIDYAQIDCLVVCVDSGREDIMRHLSTNDPKWGQHREKVVHYFDLLYGAWTQAKKLMPYRSVETACGLKFVFNSEDELIAREMLVSGRIFTEKNIDAFFRYCVEKCGYSGQEEGVFLDIGANVGTTAIYVKKRLAPQLQVYAIEACRETFDTLRMNLIANDAEEIVPSLCGISDKDGTAAYTLCDGNWGGTALREDPSGGVRMITLDQYVESMGIDAQEVRYIWMDIEGYEAKALLGAEKLLRSHKIPLFQEFNPDCYERQGIDKKYVQIIQAQYERMIVFFPERFGGHMEMQVSDLQRVREQMAELRLAQTDILFI